MNAEDLVRVFERNILAVSAHAEEEGMDDAERIRLIRVLTDTAESLLKEMGESENRIEAISWGLQDGAKKLYVESCVEENPGISNKEDFAQEFGRDI
jgi:hypothetical protein